MVQVLTLTRVYKKKGAKALSSQTVVIPVDKVVSVRASNRLGFPEHRATVNTLDGRTFDVSNTMKEVSAMLAKAK